MASVTARNRVIGILASVDSGKTTLAEALLFEAGALRQKGRVDHGDAFLDMGEMERRRGITIFSKTARFEHGGQRYILIDTPGHADFTPETERTLSVLDYCILVINGADGATAQTRRLWQLLKAYAVPVFVFVNKTDQPGVNPGAVYAELRARLSGQIADFSSEDPLRDEEIAALSEGLLEEFFRQGALSEKGLRQAIASREVFPCYFGSALREVGVRDLLDGLARWSQDAVYPDTFSARIFKISRDSEGQRLTEMKITGGTLKNKTSLGEEKINEIRLYSGTGHSLAQTAAAGEICAVTGPRSTWAGQVIGEGEEEVAPLTLPVLRYRVKLEEGGDQAKLLSVLRQIGEEMPDLSLSHREETGEVQVRVTGDLLLEVLKDLVQTRGAMTITLDEGAVLYRESVTEPILGIGHFEPLRHYAEVHLRLEPSAGTEVTASSACEGRDLLPGRQNQILQFLRESEHAGVLTGSALARMHITLAAGRDHDKHTQGGDLIQAAARALRQGLMEARARGVCVLLEPVYEFDISVPSDKTGHVLTDLDRLGATDLGVRAEDDRVRITGKGPVATLRGYAGELRALSRGEGRIRLDVAGYEICRQAQEVIRAFGYDPDRDAENPSGSIFCIGGAGQYVPWEQVPGMAHIQSPKPRTTPPGPSGPDRPLKETGTISPDEVERILNQTHNANASAKKRWKRVRTKRDETAPVPARAAASLTGPPCLFVDGYNVIHAWPDLKELASVNFDAAREKLMETLQDYEGYTGEDVTVVFDAYNVAGGAGSLTQSGGISVVFTREDETADRYIERQAMELSGIRPVKVVTSDQAEQLLASGTGALVYSSRRFREILDEVRAKARADLERRREREEPNRPFWGPLGDKSEEDGHTS